MSNIDRQAQKAITYALAYGASPKSALTQVYADEFARMAAAMAISRYSGIGYVFTSHTDFSDLELRLHQFHDEDQWTVAPCIDPEPFYTRNYTKNQRGRHWEKQRKQGVQVKPKTAQQLLDEDFANDSPSRLVHKMGDIQKPPQKKTIACRVVECCGNFTLQYAGTRWFMDTSYDIKFVS